MTQSADAIDVALKVTAAFDRLGVVHTIGGSIASSVAGEPRSTLDIDIVAALEPSHVAPLLASLQEEFYLDPDALLRAVESHRSVNVIHQETQIKVDCSSRAAHRSTRCSSHVVSQSTWVGVGSTCIHLRTSSCRSCAGFG